MVSMTVRQNAETLDENFRISMGLVPDVSVVHKFGNNSSVGTTFVPVAEGGIYRTPQISGATTLRIKAGGNANDAVAGSGAREITIIGIDATGAEISETLATAGASASADTTQEFFRVFRAFVSASGTYATQSAGSHAADVVIENSAGTEDWATIAVDGFPSGQSEIGAYTVPLGYSAYLKKITIDIESNKTVTAKFFQRQNVLQAEAPYSAMRLVQNYAGLAGSIVEEFEVPIEFPELTDLGFIAKVDTGTAAVAAAFDLKIVKNG